MSSRVTSGTGGGGGATAAQSRSSVSNSQRRHRSRSTSRYADLDKPKKKKTLSATTSLVSIPNTIKLSMLNSGLLSFEKVKLEARDENNSLSQTIPDKPIELRHFVKLCEQRRKFPVLYKLEFQTAVKVETNTCRHATRKNNQEKNQNQKCIPYDYNRVVLDKIPGVPDSDYVNASYVDSLLKPNAYIVTQGPTEETVNEFWRLVWQENVSAIVMLTKTFDFTKVMCVQYWPPNIETHETYGEIHINIVSEEQLANFQIRTFRLYKKNEEVVTEERHILQFHYTEWHSHTCPFSNAVLEFRRRVRAVVGNIIKPNSLVGPMLVHCNDGGGRSGVYMAVDANLELSEEEDCFHVFGYLKKLRQARRGLIENVDQYKFVYDTLEEHIVCGKTWFPVSELSERLKSKAKKDPATKMNCYQREYAQICKQTPRFSIGDCAGGHRGDNREKNRDVLCVPPDNFRPYLTSFQGNAFTDYINSVFVDGYTKPREYIVTEWPLKHTLGEFWSLVYDHECSAVVVLCSPPQNSQLYPAFWPPPKSKGEKFGPVFSVDFVSGKHFQNIKQWEFKVNKKIISLTEMMAGVKAPTKTVQLFQLTCWELGHKVPSSTNSLVFLMNMVETWRQRTDYGPVCVVSPDGRSRAGVYCAANACIEQVIQHGEVDVFQAVKTVRRHRPQLIDNMTEYKYCYDLVLHYVLHFLDKDHKVKKFIAFGRGKCIPLTPDNTNVDLPGEISNTGRIIVNKCIDKISKRESILQAEKDLLNRNHILDKNGKILERKKKGRLYSLGGNEPQRKGHRGRLDRLKTVGTFDLGTEMSVLSEVARNLNEQLISGELGVFQAIKLPVDTNRTILTPSLHNTSARNTPVFRKRDLLRRTPLKSPLLFEAKGCCGEFKPQHSADDCIQRACSTPPSTTKKSRSLSTSSYLLRDRAHTEPPQFELDILQIESNEVKQFEASESYGSLETEKDSKKIEEDVISVEHTGKRDFSKDFSYRSRKSMLRKSRRIVRTDSEIFKEGIIDKNEYVLKNNCDIQIHANSEDYRNEARDILGAESCRTSSIASSSVYSRKDSSDIDDIYSPKDRQKSTDESSKNLSTDDMDAVFSDSTDLERLEKEYKELIKTNLQREYKSDSDTLDEIGKKRNDFGKWKNQSLEHEFEFSNQELMNIIGDQTLSSHSYGTSTDTKDVSRICSPESYANGAYSDSGVKNLDEKYSSYTKMRSRVYSSSRVGETPTERERLHPLRNSVHSNFIVPIAAANSSISNTSPNVAETVSRSALIRPSNLEINVPTKPKPSHEGTIHSLFEKPFGRFKRVNKLLKCKRFSTSTLYDKKKPPDADTKRSPKFIGRLIGKDNQKCNLVESKGSLHLSKLSLFSQKPGKSSTFWGRKATMFSAASHSNNELFTKSGSNTKLSEMSKSNTELSKYRASPFKSSTRKYLKNEKNNSSACLATTTTNALLHSPLSEEFYNKTGSVRLSAMELYEKFCSEDFGGLYKHENFKGSERREGFASQHEYRLEKKGLRVIGRYHKNARLLKQKSEPKFNLRAASGTSSYYHEEDEYYYNNKPCDLYEYYNEQDEYYDEYGDEDVEDFEGDYYEDDEEGDYYEDEVEIEETEITIENSPHFIDKDDNDQDVLEFQFDEGGAACLELGLQNAAKKQIESTSTGNDSDVDEIFLMPSQGKCLDDDEVYGFENKHFSLEHSMLVRSNGKDQFKYLQDPTDKDSSDEGSSARNLNNFMNSCRDDDVLTIYRICSKEEIMRISDSEADDQKEAAKKQRSTSLQCESLEKAVKEYIKYATSEISMEPTIIKTDCTNIDRTDSLELLSNSSGTMRSRSTLTEYAFDTVRNLNLDSCSTSKLSLSLKSEVFDDFTITPDDLKTIQNCEFEDFTLTPDGSIGEGTTEIVSHTKTCTPTTVDKTKEPDEDDKVASIEEECPSGALVIVDKFLTNERNNLHRQTSIDIDVIENESIERDQQQSRPQVLETSFDLIVENPDTSADNENTEDCETKTIDSSYYTPTTEPSTTSNEYTIIDLYDDEDQTVSLFTSELTKEFDRLFSKAEQNCDNTNNIGDCSFDTTDTIIDRPKIPSRYSMQKLEPYYIADPDDSDNAKPTPTPTENNVVKVVEMTPKQIASNQKNSTLRLKKTRSQSLGNLNKKTKCFPL